MPDNLAGCRMIVETIAERYESVCLRPMPRKSIEENYTTDFEGTKIRSEENLAKAEIQRRFSAPARCTRVTDLDAAAAIIARHSFHAPKYYVKSITNATLDQYSEMSKNETGRTTNYVDMDGTKNLGLQGRLRLREKNELRRVSSSAITKKFRNPDYHNLIHMKPDDQLNVEQSVLLGKDWMKPVALDTRRNQSSPADCALLIHSTLESRVSSCCDNNLSYVNMGKFADEGDEHKGSIVTPHSRSTDLTEGKKCSPETRVDSGCSSFESVSAYDRKTNSPNSDASSGTSDELYFSCRTHFSQTKEGQNNLKLNNDVKTIIQQLVALIPLKKYFSSIVSNKSSVSMPNIHNATHRGVQKGTSLPSNSPKSNEIESHTLVNMSWANGSFNEALDNPIKIPSHNSSTISEKPSFESCSTKENNIEKIKNTTTSVSRCLDNDLGNLTKILIDGRPNTLVTKSKFTSMTTNTTDEVLTSKKLTNSDENSYFFNNQSNINTAMEEPPKTHDHQHSLRTTDSSVIIGDLPKKICAIKTNPGIFSLKDLIFEQRYEKAKTRSESVLRMNSNLETMSIDDPAKRFLRFSSSSNTSNRIRNDNSSNSSSNTVSSLHHPMFNQSHQLIHYGQTLPPGSNTSCSPLLQTSHDTSMTTNTSSWIPVKKIDRIASHSRQNNSNLFVDTALERTSSTPLLEWPASLLTSPAFFNTSSELEWGRNKSNHLREFDESSSDVVPDRPQLLQYLFRTKSLAFHSHPLLPLLHRLIWLEFTLLHAPLEIKLLLSPHPRSLSALLTHYCNKRPQAKAFVDAVLPRGLVSSGQREGVTTTGYSVETPLPTLHRVMLEVLASTHYSVVDLMTELVTSNVPARNDPESDRTSSSIQNVALKFSACNRRFFTIHSNAKNGPESVSGRLNKSTARPSIGVDARRPSCNVFYQKLPSFV